MNNVLRSILHAALLRRVARSPWGWAVVGTLAAADAYRRATARKRARRRRRDSSSGARRLEDSRATHNPDRLDAVGVPLDRIR